METNEILSNIQTSLAYLAPEAILAAAIICLIFLGFFQKENTNTPVYITILVAVAVIIVTLSNPVKAEKLFAGSLQYDTFSNFFKLIFNASVILTCLISLQRSAIPNRTEFCILLLTIVLGCHFLTMSTNLLMMFLSIEIISITSYMLVGFDKKKATAEASLKYFLFGAAASAVMLYGFSILYGLSGSLNFTAPLFRANLMSSDPAAVMIGGLMILGGLMFKIAAAPMHFWTPDIYEAAPIPVVAFFSVVPKLAGFAVLIRFILAISFFGASTIDWQLILALITMITITIGNFAALAQNNVKRLMAYSSIAQSGFLLIGVVAFSPQAVNFMLFYATVYTVMNFVVFLYLEYFEKKGFANVADFAGQGKFFLWPLIFMLIALISLTGLPPTAGFTGKLFLFSGLWESYQLTGKSLLLWLLVFGLLNTVVSLFYYLKIPYYAFLKTGQIAEKQNFLTGENLLGTILVIVILALFFHPGLLMGWINSVNFVF